MARAAHRESLQWAIVDGGIRHVSEFAGLPPRQRPAAECPECGKPVVLKLGEIKVFHAAHHPGSECRAGESALHLNCKLHIAEQLRQASSLSILTPCASGSSLNSPCSPVLWVEGWDSVEVEYGVGSCRPDICLLRAGQVVGAIEILVTHEVDAEKAKYLNTLGVQWIEIAASPEPYESSDLWSAASPIAVTKIGASPFEAHLCERHRRQREALSVLGATAGTLPAFKARIRCWRSVDFRFGDGRRFRDLFFIVETRDIAGNLDTISLWRNHIQIFDTTLVGLDGNESACLERLGRKFRAAVAQTGNTARADTSVRWAPPPADVTLPREFMACGYGRQESAA